MQILEKSIRHRVLITRIAHGNFLYPPVFRANKYSGGQSFAICIQIPNTNEMHVGRLRDGARLLSGTVSSIPLRL